jgi:hypothetical protein
MAAPPKLRSLRFEDLPGLPTEVKPLVDALNPFLVDVGNGIGGQLVIGQNVAGGYKTVDVVVPSPWTTLADASLKNSWVNFGSDFDLLAGYRIDASGRVYLKGFVKDGTAVDGTEIFTLPAGYRPAGRKRFSVSSNSAAGGCDVYADGKVAFSYGSNTNFSLEGIAFDAVPAAAPPAFSGTGWPLVMQTGMSLPPKAVFVAQALDLASDAYTLEVGQPEWRLNAKGQVVVRRIGGLTPQRKYRLTFLFLA